MEPKNIEGFDIKRMLLPEELEWLFLGEVALRTFIMFVVILLFFKLTGKRSIYQLSLFELALIVGLGSAAGDPMFYQDVGLLPVLVVFVVIAMLYKGLTYLTLKSERAERIIEGKPDPLFLNDKMVIEALDSEAISYDEFFAFLRIKHVEHLGQIRAAYLETTGDVSLFFYPDKEVKYGLPILPEALKFHYTEIRSDGIHSCIKCGHTTSFTAGQIPVCSNCNSNTWLRSINSLRLS